MESESEDEKHVPIINYLVEYMAKLFGVSGLAEKRRKEFLTSLFKYKQNKKLMLFMRFLGMDAETANYSDLEIAMYLDAV